PCGLKSPIHCNSLSAHSGEISLSRNQDFTLTNFRLSTYAVAIDLNAMDHQRREIQSMANSSKSLQLNYWQQQERAFAPTGGGGGDADCHPECIIVDKVYDECTVCECPTFRFTELIPERANVISCDVANVRVIDAGIPREGE